MNAPARPVKLQVNNSGAWKDVIRFDASNHVAAGQAMAAGSMLGELGQVKFRIVVDDGTQDVLMHWDSAARDWEARQ